MTAMAGQITLPSDSTSKQPPFCTLMEINVTTTNNVISDKKTHVLMHCTDIDNILSCHIDAFRKA